MEKSELELRMYGLVPYNISPIQQGIQFGHSVVEWLNKYPKDKDTKSKYNRWSKDYKTFIILNGGTTNKSVSSPWYGSLNQHRDFLINNDIRFSEFNEPDLGDQLTALTFIIDERVFNNKKYVNLKEFLKVKYLKYNTLFDFIGDEMLGHFNSIDNALNLHPIWVNSWIKSVGGIQNANLKQWLMQFRLV